MEFGVPRERSGGEIPERRVPLTPQGVRELVASGHRVYVERGAGEGAGFPDEAYEEAGARLVGREEAFGRPQVVLKVARPTLEEVGLMRKNAVLMAFLHLAVAESPLVEAMAQKGLTAIGYELVGEEGRRPVLKAMSEIAGRMAPQLAGRLLEAPQGPGILLSGLVGIPPADVVVLGAGVLGRAAARAFLGAGASVHLLDRALPRWRRPPGRPRGPSPPSSPRTAWSGTWPSPTSWWGRWPSLGSAPPFSSPAASSPACAPEASSWTSP